MRWQAQAYLFGPAPSQPLNPAFSSGHFPAVQPAALQALSTFVDQLPPAQRPEGGLSETASSSQLGAGSVGRHCHELYGSTEVVTKIMRAGEHEGIRRAAPRMPPSQSVPAFGLTPKQQRMEGE